MPTAQEWKDGIQKEKAREVKRSERIPQQNLARDERVARRSAEKEEAERVVKELEKKIEEEKERERREILRYNEGLLYAEELERKAKEADEALERAIEFKEEEAERYREGLVFAEALEEEAKEAKELAAKNEWEMAKDSEKAAEEKASAIAKEKSEWKTTLVTLKKRMELTTENRITMVRSLKDTISQSMSQLTSGMQEFLKSNRNSVDVEPDLESEPESNLPCVHGDQQCTGRFLKSYRQSLRAKNHMVLSMEDYNKLMGSLNELGDRQWKAKTKLKALLRRQRRQLYDKTIEIDSDSEPEEQYMHQHRDAITALDELIRRDEAYEDRIDQLKFKI